MMAPDPEREDRDHECLDFGILQVLQSPPKRRAHTSDPERSQGPILKIDFEKLSALGAHTGLMVVAKSYYEPPN